MGAGLALARGLQTGHVSVGVGVGSPLSDVLFGGLVGLLAGSVLAETWRVRPRASTRHAELAPRSNDPGAASLLPVVTLLTAATVALTAAAPSPRTAFMAAMSAALFLAHRLVLRAVGGRGRPALPDELRHADDAIRAYAGRRIGIESVAGAVLLLGWQVANVTPPLADSLSAALQLLAVVVTIVLVRRSRPWPPTWPHTSPATRTG